MKARTYYGEPICQRCGGVGPGCVCGQPALRALEKAMDEHCACNGHIHDECREDDE